MYCGVHHHQEDEALLHEGVEAVVGGRELPEHLRQVASVENLSKLALTSIATLGKLPAKAEKLERTVS